MGFTIARQADLHFKLHANEGRINHAQFLDAVANLNLQVSGVTNGITKFGKYFGQFKIPDTDLYDVGKLVTLGVLCSRDNAGVKADILFDHMDPDLTKKISKDTFDQLLTGMIEVAVKFNPDLGVGDAAEKLCESGRLMSYKASLLSVVPASKEKIVTAVFGGAEQMEKAAFVSKVSGSIELQKLFDCYGLRNYLVMTVKNAPPGSLSSTSGGP